MKDVGKSLNEVRSHTNVNLKYLNCTHLQSDARHQVNILSHPALKNQFSEFPSSLSLAWYFTVSNYSQFSITFIRRVTECQSKCWEPENSYRPGSSILLTMLCWGTQVLHFIRNYGTVPNLAIEITRNYDQPVTVLMLLNSCTEFCRRKDWRFHLTCNSVAIFHEGTALGVESDRVIKWLMLGPD